MEREDKFVGLLTVKNGTTPIDYGDGPVAIFKLVYPFTYINERYDGQTYSTTETHFHANLESVRLRAANLSLPKNYGKVPWSLVQERAAEQAILSAA